MPQVLDFNKKQPTKMEDLEARLKDLGFSVNDLRMQVLAIRSLTAAPSVMAEALMGNHSGYQMELQDEIVKLIAKRKEEHEKTNNGEAGGESSGDVSDSGTSNTPAAGDSEPQPGIGTEPSAGEGSGDDQGKV